MAHSCTLGSCCWLWSIGLFLVWWFLASALLWVSWNRVIGALVKVKPAKYWQALVLVATVCMLCAPSWYVSKRCGMKPHCGRCHSEGVELQEGGAFDSKPCPYTKKSPGTPEG